MLHLNTMWGRRSLTVKGAEKDEMEEGDLIALICKRVSVTLIVTILIFNFEGIVFEHHFSSDILVEVFKYLTPNEVRKNRLVCTFWKGIVSRNKSVLPSTLKTLQLGLVSLSSLFFFQNCHIQSRDPPAVGYAGCGRFNQRANCVSSRGCHNLMCVLADNVEYSLRFNCCHEIQVWLHI